MSSFASANQVSRLLVGGLLGHQTQSSVLQTVSGQLSPYAHQDSFYPQALLQPNGHVVIRVLTALQTMISPVAFFCDACILVHNKNCLGAVLRCL